MSPLPTSGDPVPEPVDPHARAPHQRGDEPRDDAGASARHLRLARPEAADAAMRARAARAARVIHGGLIFAVAANVMVVGIDAVPLLQRVIGAVVAGLAFLAAFRMARRDVTFARLSPLAQGIYRARATATGAAALGSIAWFVPWLQLSVGRVLIAACAIVVVASAWGQLTRRLLGGNRVHRTLIIGDGERVGRFLREFAADPHPEYEIVGLLTETAAGVPPEVEPDTTLAEIVELLDEASGGLAGVPVLGGLEELETVLAAEGVDTVVVSVRRNRLELFSRLGAYAANNDVTVQELPAYSEQVFGRVPIDVINAAWFMHMIHPFYRPYSRAVKRAADIAAALLIGLVALPLMPLVALAVRLTSPGPIFYRQVRVGERGREFSIVKFRTMRQDAESAGAQWAQRNDPRVTPVGRIMRTTRLDELPQLWNVLRGQMSFVGPRPERPEFVTDLERQLPYYQRRHLVKPGLTGWAQVRLGYADSIEGSAHKLGCELYYLKHQSLFLDFVICVETVRVVLLRVGSR